MKALKRDIGIQKAKLKGRADKKGVYENFGQKEVRVMEEKHIDVSSYTPEMNAKRNAIADFDNWCSDYCW